MAMFTAQHHAAVSNGLGNGIEDGAAINPSALNSSVLSSNEDQAPPRGIKRSRSPADSYTEYTPGVDVDDDGGDEQKRRKRGRPPKQRVPETPSSNQQSSQTTNSQLQTPQLQHLNLRETPTKPSPPKFTPSKSIVKALPTVRDHTTDQLGPEGDEYIPREFDDAGETKVSQDGEPLGGRVFKCRIFHVTARGQKRFMLATECARVLGYRDSYLLFNKNRSLFKIIATQAEKDDLIQQDVLPYSYRSRQIAIVTAKSMFRQFGARLVENGRRVRDDYWETKARKQGFTEDDPAGEKRPGAGKAAREAQAAAEATNNKIIALSQGQVIYRNVPVSFAGTGHPQSHARKAKFPPLPMIHAPPVDELRMKDFVAIQRPKFEYTGLPYQDRSQPSTAAEIGNQAQHAADFNKSLNQERVHRVKYLEDVWNKPGDPQITSSLQQPGVVADANIASGQQIHSPLLSSTGIMNTPQQASMPLPQPAPPQMMAAQIYPPQPYQHPHLPQSPLRNATQIRPDQLHHRSSGLSMSSVGGHQPPPSFGYGAPSPMWGQPPSQPQQSPLSAQPGLPQYGGQLQTQSPRPTPSPHHPPLQMHQQPGPGSMHPSPMGYQAVAGLPAVYPNYPPREMYQTSQAQQPYLSQTPVGQQPNMQGWPSTPQQQQQPHGAQGWPGY